MTNIHNTTHDLVPGTVSLSTHFAIGFAVTFHLPHSRSEWCRSSLSVLFGGAELSQSIDWYNTHRQEESRVSSHTRCLACLPILALSWRCTKFRNFMFSLYPSVILIRCYSKEWDCRFDNRLISYNQLLTID